VAPFLCLDPEWIRSLDFNSRFDRARRRRNIHRDQGRLAPSLGVTAPVPYGLAAYPPSLGVTAPGRDHRGVRVKERWPQAGGATATGYTRV